MGKLLYSKNIGFNMLDWKREAIAKVFAGTDCIMALTKNGRVLQKIENNQLAARLDYWTNVTDIALSQWASGLAIGLVKDGTCLIAKRPLRALCKNGNDFDRINEAVKSWKNIVCVRASDAFFGLDSFGNVHYATTTELDCYRETKTWKNVVRIITGTQGSLFGITADGHIYAAGYNTAQVADRLAVYQDALDLCVSGTACNAVYVLRQDGTVDCAGIETAFPCNCVAMQSHTVGVAVQKTDGSLHFHSYCYPDAVPEAVFKDKPVASFALGDRNYGPTFVLAVGQD